jgi:hypothetical protein
MGKLEFTLYFRKTQLEKEAIPFGWNLLDHPLLVKVPI